MGHSKQRTKGKITGLPAHVTVANELDAAAVMRAALELGPSYHAQNDDSDLELPARITELLCYSVNQTQAVTDAAAAAETAKLTGQSYAVEVEDWATIQVNAARGHSSHCL